MTESTKGSRIHIRIFDENHSNDWQYFFICALVCNFIYILGFMRFDIEYHSFPLIGIGMNLITPVCMFFCELGERSIYG